MGAEFWFGLIVVCGVILAVSMIGDAVLEHGPFWLFWLITIVGMGLMLAAIQAVREVIGA
jgi:hypothetical protein